LTFYPTGGVNSDSSWSLTYKTMALATVFAVTRANYGTALSTPYTRGKVLNGYQTEEQVVTKLTGDATGNITMTRSGDHHESR
jgi:hypothetical protein